MFSSHVKSKDSYFPNSDNSNYIFATLTIYTTKWFPMSNSHRWNSPPYFQDQEKECDHDLYSYEIPHTQSHRSCSSISDNSYPQPLQWWWSSPLEQTYKNTIINNATGALAHVTDNEFMLLDPELSGNMFVRVWHLIEYELVLSNCFSQIFMNFNFPFILNRNYFKNIFVLDVSWYFQIMFSKKHLQLGLTLICIKKISSKEEIIYIHCFFKKTDFFNTSLRESIS